MKHLLVFLLLPVILFAQGHLLITEVFIPPSGEGSAAFIEIFNPTDAAISLNQMYLANYNTYYNVVNGTYSTNAAHFAVKFPDIELAVDEALAVAVNGQSFFDYFGKRADYEVLGSDDTTPDMVHLKVGDNPSFALSSGMIVLFAWDGSADLIQDVDYVPWGIFPSGWMDKSTVEIDGPDADSDAAAYKNDLAKSSQQAQTVPTGGKSLQRSGLAEVDEVSSGGNGIGGHNEATENWKSSFIAASPGPGSFSENPGDGTGVAAMSPDSVIAESEIDAVIQITGTADYTLATVEITIPEAWGWDGSITRSGSGLAMSSESISGNVITISNAVITDTETGTVTINNLTTPEQTGNYVFEIKTAVAGGGLTEIGVFPAIYVKEPIVIETISIREARQLGDGSSVSVKGIVVIGAGTLRDDRTDVYIQDESGYAINIFDFDLDPRLERGNEVYVQGTIEIYEGRVEIVDYTLTIIATGVELPEPVRISTFDASTTFYDSRYVMVVGKITRKSSSGGGTNLSIDDGTGPCTARVWDTADLNLDEFDVDSTVVVKGMGSIYSDAGQILLAHQEDIYIPFYDGSPAKLTLPNKPFVPDKGEVLDITFQSGAESSHINLRIFDLGGRLIRTLMDGAGMPIEQTIQWNGRNHIEELVPLGTYICHLEIVNEDTGKRTEKVAPIVVGTVLK